MDRACLTIDRHTPILPPSVHFGLCPKLEKYYTTLKNKVLLPDCGIKEINRWRRVSGNKWPSVPRKIITEEMLVKGEWAVNCSHGILEDHLQKFAYKRGLTPNDIERYKVCSTAKLCELLDESDIINLSLEISEKFKSIIKNRSISGLSFPYWYNGKFMGFCTRIVDNDLCKYSISIPHRFCWGLESGGDEVYIVEGIFDAIAIRRLGYNVMAMADSQPNFYKLRIANDFNHVFIMLDGDYSGLLGAVKAYYLLTKMFDRDPRSISILWLENHKDPSEALSDGDFAVSKITYSQAIDILEALGKDINPLDFII